MAEGNGVKAGTKIWNAVVLHTAPPLCTLLVGFAVSERNSAAECNKEMNQIRITINQNVEMIKSLGDKLDSERAARQESDLAERHEVDTLNTVWLARAEKISQIVEKLADQNTHLIDLVAVQQKKGNQ